MPTNGPSAPRLSLRDLFNVAPRERPLVLMGATMFFLLFTGYFMLRPVRETMGIAGGVDNLQWLFTATFVATLVALLFVYLLLAVGEGKNTEFSYFQF